MSVQFLSKKILTLWKLPFFIVVDSMYWLRGQHFYYVIIYRLRFDMLDLIKHEFTNRWQILSLSLYGNMKVNNLNSTMTCQPNYHRERYKHRGRPLHACCHYAKAPSQSFPFRLPKKHQKIEENKNSEIFVNQMFDFMYLPWI